MKAVAADPQYELGFQDEVHFRVQTTITRKWVPKGSAPKVGSNPRTNSVAYSGIVLPRTGELLVSKPQRFTFETVIQALREFLAARPPEEGRKYCIVFDNAPWHKKTIRLVWKEADPLYEDIRAAMDYLSLPPYCPHLNPIEQVWRETRREKTHNHWFQDLTTLVATTDGYFERFRHSNECLKTLCTFSWFQANPEKPAA